MTAAAAVTIRNATRDDLPEITAIYGAEVRAGAASFELEPPDLAEMTARFEMLMQGGFPYLAADLGGRLAGYAYAGPYHRRAAYRFTVEDSVYVAAHARGTGVGGTLLRALVLRSAQDGYRQMIAIISRSGSSDASRALHAAAGFTDAGRLRDVGYKFGEWRDIMIMQRALGAGAGEPPPEGR